MNYWLFFAILAPVLWGFTVIIDTVFRRNYIKNDLVMTWFVAIPRFLTAIVLLSIFGINSASLSDIIWIILAGTIWIIPVFLYFRALEFEEGTIVALLFTFTPVFTIILAYFLIGEQLNFHQLIAFVLILIGGVLAAFKAGSPTHKKWKLSRAFWLIAFAGLLWAAGDVFFKLLETSFSNYFIALAYFLVGSSLPLLIISASKRGRSLVKKHTANLSGKVWVLMTVNMSFGIGAIFSLTYALTLGTASLTNVLTGFEPLTVFVVGAVLSRFTSIVEGEDLSRKSLLLKGLSFILILVGLFYLQ